MEAAQHLAAASKEGGGAAVASAVSACLDRLWPTSATCTGLLQGARLHGQAKPKARTRDFAPAQAAAWEDVQEMQAALVASERKRQMLVRNNRTTLATAKKRVTAVELEHERQARAAGDARLPSPLTLAEVSNPGLRGTRRRRRAASSRAP